MQKGIIVVDSLWGVGHRKRMALLAAELSKKFSIDFFQAAPDVGIRAASSSVKHHFIPSLFHLTAIGDANFPSPEEMVEREKERVHAYQTHLTGEYAFILYEQFPFGKKPLRYDLDLLYALVRKENPKVKRISSFRGYQWEDFPGEFMQFTKGSIENQFDLVLLHIDERYKEELLPKRMPLSSKCHFTGFIADERLTCSSEKKREKIVVTTGGGTQGEALVQAAFELAKELHEIPFRFFSGPLKAMEIPSAEPFSEKNYRSALEEAALLISLGGYNTLMDHYISKTPAVVFAGAADQPILTNFFAKRGSVIRVTEEDLELERFKKLVLKQMHFSNWMDELNTEGLHRSLQLICRLTE